MFNGIAGIVSEMAISMCGIGADNSVMQFAESAVSNYKDYDLIVIGTERISPKLQLLFIPPQQYR